MSVAPLVLGLLLQTVTPIIEETPVIQDDQVIDLVPVLKPKPEPVAVSVMGGGQVGFATEANNSYVPFVRVGVKVPLAAHPQAPRLHTVVDLTSATGAAAEISSPQSWTAIEVALGLSAYPFEGLNVGLWAEGGFSSRLPGDTTPTVKAPRWGYGGVIFDRFKVGSLKLGFGADQRLDGYYQPAVTVKGWVALRQAKTGGLKGAMITLVGDAVLGMNQSDYSQSITGGVSDVIRAGIGVGWTSRR